MNDKIDKAIKSFRDTGNDRHEISVIEFLCDLNDDEKKIFRDIIKTNPIGYPDWKPDQ